MDPSSQLLPAQIANRCIIFREGSLPNSASVPRGHSAEFSARPRSEWDLALNRFIHTSALNGYVDPDAAYKLLGLHIVALILPPCLARWLVRWDRPQVERAIACILIDAAGIEGPSEAPDEWPPQDNPNFDAPPHPNSPNNVLPHDTDLLLAPQANDAKFDDDLVEVVYVPIDDFDDAMSYDSDDIPPCPALVRQHELQNAPLVPETPPLSALIHGIPAEQRAHPCPALPYVTEASKQLDDLLQLLAGDTLWTIPVQFVALHPRRVLAPDAPPDVVLDDDCGSRSPRSYASCLNTDLELDSYLSFNIPPSSRVECGLFTQAAALNSKSVCCLFEKWTRYNSHVAKAGVHPRRALYNFGRLVASGKENELWERISTILDIAGIEDEYVPCTSVMRTLPSLAPQESNVAKPKFDDFGEVFTAFTEEYDSCESVPISPCSALSTECEKTGFAKGEYRINDFVSYAPTHLQWAPAQVRALGSDECSSRHSNWCLHAKCRCDAHTLGCVRKRSTYAKTSGGTGKKSRRLLQTLPVDLVKDVLVPKIIAALSD